MCIQYTFYLAKKDVDNGIEMWYYIIKLRVIQHRRYEMKQIKVYDLDFEEIANICEDNNVDEWEVIEAMFDAIRDKKIDITKWL